jgi:hypothetical protein
VAVREHATWDGVTQRFTYQNGIVEQRDRLAACARGGDWPAVLAQLAANAEWVNATRLGGDSGYTVLHQAAWNGADTAVVLRLIGLGAWRTVRTTDGERAIDIADRRGHRHLTGALRPVIRRPVRDDVLARLQWRLHALIRERAGHLVEQHRLRLPDLGPLTEVTEPTFWFPVPGMHGGFSYRLDHAGLIVESWCRVVGGSGQRHRITPDGTELVASGWI